jgi:class 3 adenylate cyclase
MELNRIAEMQSDDDDNSIIFSNRRTDIIKESQKRIKKALIEGFQYDHLVIEKSDHFLRKHTFQKLGFAVMFIDLVGSTRMSTELTPDLLSRIITVFSQETSYVVEMFGGFVLKFVGDAVVSYFPHNSNIDDIILCARSIIDIVRDAINLLLLQMGHNGIEVKITSDYGEHAIVRYGSDALRSHVDIISSTMNLTAKMQSITIGGQMIIGERLYEKLSDRFKHAFEKARADISKWDYHSLSGQKPYQLFIITF